MLKSNGGVVECMVSDPDHKPLPEAHIVLVPDPPRHFQMALQKNCSTNADGTCTLSGVTPGAYHAFAFGTETDIDFRQTDTLKGIENFGKSIKVDEGEKKNGTAN